MRFKKGDYVRVEKSGKEGIISNIETKSDIQVVGFYFCGYYEDFELSIVENLNNISIWDIAYSTMLNFTELKDYATNMLPKFPSIRHLTDATIIELRNGERECLGVSNDKKIQCYDGDIDEIYNENLTHKVDLDKDIVALYDSYCSCGIESEDIEGEGYMLLKLWERI